MLWIAYLALAVALSWRLLQGRWRGRAPAPSSVPRAGGLTLSLGLALLAVALFADAQGESGHSAAELGSLILAVLVVGALALAGGLALWTGRLAMVLRGIGFAAVVAALAIPSTLTVLLLLVSPLVVVLVEVRPAADGRRSAERTPAGDRPTAS
jgi:hypothetical protein